MKLSKLLASTTIIVVSSALGVEGKTSLRSAGKNDAEKHSLDLKHFNQEERRLGESPPVVDTTKEDGVVVPGGSRIVDLNRIQYSTCTVQTGFASGTHYGRSEQLYESKMAMYCPPGLRPIMWKSMYERECRKDKIQCFWTEDQGWSEYLQCYVQVAGTNKCEDDDNALPFGVEFTCCEFA